MTKKLRAGNKRPTTVIARKPDALAEALRAVVDAREAAGTPLARKAAEVARRALHALAEPLDPSHAEAVERMHASLQGVKPATSDVYEVADAIERAANAALPEAPAGALGEARRVAVSQLRQAIGSRWPRRTEVVSDAFFDALLADLEFRRVRLSGAVARVLLRLGFGPSQAESAGVLESVTHDVTESLRLRRQGLGPRSR